MNGPVLDDREGTLPKVGEVLQHKAKCQCEFSFSPGWFEWLMTVDEFAEFGSHDGSQLRCWQHPTARFSLPIVAEVRLKVLKWEKALES